MLCRFQGCLVGAVVGDCVGSIFEGQTVVRVNDLLNKVNQLEALYEQEHGRNSQHEHCLRYTDDTAMARSVALSLLEKQHFDARDMASRFSDQYYKEPDRGYGGSIATVFWELQNPDLVDVFKPASLQFGGSGSFGNGGAMRIAPAALFAFPNNDQSKLQELVTSITKLTHTHHLALTGALLQALAVDESLRWSCTELDVQQFLDHLLDKLRPFELETAADTPPSANTRRLSRQMENLPTPYCAKLTLIKELLKNKELGVEEVVSQLGNDVSAFGSVPTAVLAFLRAASQRIPEFSDRNQFEQTVLYAISLGGDTDTIATMAAAMAGALYGLEQIPASWRFLSEGEDQAQIMAGRFFQRTVSSNCD